MAYYVEKGETVSGLTLKNDAIYVSSGGTATDTVLNYSSFMIVSKGGSANSATINSGGELHISSGGTATNTLIQSGGVMSASDDGMWVKSGGVAKGVTLAPSGYLKVYSGGTATNIVENGGYAYIEGQLDGGNPNVKFKSNTFSGLELGSGRFATVHSGTTANDITINYSGKLQIFSNGIANSATVNSGGLLTVFSGGTANDTLVNSGGSLFLSGTANRATVVSEGRLTILSRGAANNTTVEGGCIEVSSGGNANNTVLVSSGLVEITSGGKANSVTVNLDGNMWIYSGGSASDIMANSGGYVCISSGGSAKNVVENGGYVFIADELESSGYSNVTFKKNSFSGLVLTGDGPEKERKATVHSGTTATNTTVNSDGLLDVLDGIAYDTMVNGGTMHVFYGTANSAVVNDGGYLAIEPDGIANSVTVNSNGTINIMTGASVNSATVNPGGHLDILSGGTATGVVENGGDVYDEDGAEVTFLPNTFSGVALTGGKNATVHSGTIANDTVVNSDSILLVYSSGFANGVTVNRDGKLWIYERGLVNGLTVSSGGELNVGYDGWLTGRITFQPGAIVIPDTVGSLDFDLTQTTAGAAPLVNDLSFISNEFTFTLTVNGMQTDGTYKLAGGAAAFDQTVCVFDTRGKSLGTLTVNGGTLSTPRADYTLKKNGSNLTVDVVAKMTENGPPEPYNNTLYDKTTGVNEKVTGSYGAWLSAPNDEIFIDKIGTVSETVGGIPYSNRVGTDDPIDYGKIVLEHGAKLSFHAEASAAATFTVYSLTPKKNGKYAKKKLATLKLKDKDKDGVFTADSKKPLSLQVSGPYYVSMQFKNKKAEEAYYNVSLNDDYAGAVFYPLGDNTDDWGDMKTAGYGGTVDDLGVINNASLASGGHIIKNEWIGFGDKFDYTKFTLTSAAELSFTVGAPDGPLKLTVCTLKARTSKKGVTTYSPVTVKTISVKAGQDANLSSLRFESGDYFFKVHSGDIKQSTDYGVQFTDGTFYSDGDNGWNDILLDKTELNENVAYFYDNKLTGNGSIHFDKAGNDRASANAASFTFGGKQYGGFVGFGDELDFAKISLKQSADVMFSVTATGDATLEVLQLTLKNGKYTQKSIQTVKYKTGDDKATSKKAVHLEVRDGVSYYVSVKATNTKKTSVDPRTYYNVSYIVESKDACALARPENSDSLAMTDVIGSALPGSDLLANASALDKLAAADDASGWQTAAKLA